MNRYDQDAARPLDCQEWQRQAEELDASEARREGRAEQRSEYRLAGEDPDQPAFRQPRSLAACVVDGEMYDDGEGNPPQPEQPARSIHALPPAPPQPAPPAEPLPDFTPHSSGPNMPPPAARPRAVAVRAHSRAKAKLAACLSPDDKQIPPPRDLPPPPSPEEDAATERALDKAFPSRVENRAAFARQYFPPPPPARPARTPAEELAAAVEDLVRQHTAGSVIDAAWEAAHRIFKPNLENPRR
jgi:hypothetical protein